MAGTKSQGVGRNESQHMGEPISNLIIARGERDDIPDTACGEKRLGNVTRPKYIQDENGET